jgi:glyoxylase-like metal-dependent hydrolase (beta-lactamase superfamily II)
MVDGGEASWSDALLRTVGERAGGKPIRALFNTHWHPEQTGSNETLGARGTEIIAHENTKLWLGTKVDVRWSASRTHRCRPRGVPRPRSTTQTTSRAFASVNAAPSAAIC